MTLIVSERAAISLLRASILCFITLLFCSSSFLSEVILASSSLCKKFWSFLNSSLITFSVCRAWSLITAAVKSQLTLTWLKCSSLSCKGFKDVLSCSLLYCAASSIGLKLWLVCVLESRQTIHTGCWWSKQKSFSFSECRLQRASLPAEALSSRESSCNKASHRFLNAKLNGGSVFEDLLLQTGHWRIPLSAHQVCKQSLQKLWLHDSTTGFFENLKTDGTRKVQGWSQSHVLQPVITNSASRSYFESHLSQTSQTSQHCTETAIFQSPMQCPELFLLDLFRLRGKCWVWILWSFPVPLTSVTNWFSLRLKGEESFQGISR